jgi:hypothetical protein
MSNNIQSNLSIPITSPNIYNVNNYNLCKIIPSLLQKYMKFNIYKHLLIYFGIKSKWVLFAILLIF